MFSLLHNRECGSVGSLTFSSSLITYRILHLDLSTSVEFQSVTGSIINYLDLDLVECRYLLAGQSDGAIFIFDTERCVDPDDSTNRPEYKCIATICRKSDTPRRPVRRSHQSGISQLSSPPRIQQQSSRNRVLRDDPNFLMENPQTLQAQSSQLNENEESPVVGREAVPNSNSPGVLDGHQYAIRTVQWYPVDTGLFVSSSTDKTVKVWDTNVLKCIDEYPFKGMIYGHHMSPCATKHNLVAVATNSGRSYLIDLISGTSVHTLAGHRDEVVSLRWSTRDEYELVTGGDDGKCLLWDIRSTRGAKLCLDQYNGFSADANPFASNSAHAGMVKAVEFTHDGLHILSYGADERLRLWDALSGKCSSVNFGPIQNSLPYGVRFSLSKNTRVPLIFMPSDTSILVLNQITGEIDHELTGHYNQVCSCVYNPVLHELYSSGHDHNLLIWQYDKEINSVSLRKESESGTTNFYQRVGGGDNWSDDEN